MWFRVVNPGQRRTIFPKGVRSWHDAQWDAQDAVAQRVDALVADAVGARVVHAIARCRRVVRRAGRLVEELRSTAHWMRMRMMRRRLRSLVSAKGQRCTL